MNKKISIILILGLLTASSYASDNYSLNNYEKKKDWFKPWYDDYNYKKHTKKGYQFGIKLGTEYSSEYKETLMKFGIDTQYVLDWDRSGINVSGNVGVDYSDKLLGANENDWEWDVNGKLGFDRFIHDTNFYVGLGRRGWDEATAKYLFCGVDYIFNEDIVLTLDLKHTKELKNKEVIDNRFGVNLTIPFNLY